MGSKLRYIVLVEIDDAILDIITDTQDPDEMNSRAVATASKLIEGVLSKDLESAIS